MDIPQQCGIALSRRDSAFMLMPNNLKWFLTNGYSLLVELVLKLFENHN